MTKQRLAELFRSWMNDFLTVSKYAAYYQVTESQAYRIIRLGRKCHNRFAADLAK